MIAAGVVDTKIVGAVAGVNARPGICFFTSAKFASSGSRERRRQLPAGIQGPLASGAASQPPLLKQVPRLRRESENTSQLVFTANESVVL